MNRVFQGLALFNIFITDLDEGVEGGILINFEDIKLGVDKYPREQEQNLK